MTILSACAACWPMILPPRLAPPNCFAGLLHRNETSTDMKISVVIPVLNERDSLPATIAALRACRGIAESVVSETGVSKTAATKTAASTIMLSEIIIADGGSTDGTADWVRAQPDLILVSSARGKGPQLNAGATRTTGDVLLFLHADCILSQPAFRALQSAWADNVV